MIGDELFMKQLEDDMQLVKFPHPKNSAIIINELYKISLIWDCNMAPVDRKLILKFIARLMLRCMTMNEIKQLGVELQNGGK